jgi:hypothetical protein
MLWISTRVVSLIQSWDNGWGPPPDIARRWFAFAMTHILRCNPGCKRFKSPGGSAGEVPAATALVEDISPDVQARSHPLPESGSCAVQSLGGKHAIE